MAKSETRQKSKPKAAEKAAEKPAKAAPKVEGPTSVWVKPNGKEIEINNRKENLAFAESLGWKRAK